MKIINNPPKKEWNALLQRPTQTLDDIESTVTQIFEDCTKKQGHCNFKVYPII